LVKQSLELDTDRGGVSRPTLKARRSIAFIPNVATAPADQPSFFATTTSWPGYLDPYGLLS
jgi:hypothetical protein